MVLDIFFYPGEVVNGAKVEYRLKVRPGWYTLPLLFRLVILKCIFMFKSNSLCKSEKRITESAFFLLYFKVFIFLRNWRSKGTRGVSLIKGTGCGYILTLLIHAETFCL